MARPAPILSLRAATDDDAELMARVDEGLGRYNEQAAPLHEVIPLCCVAESGEGHLLGGLRGRLWGAAAEVQQLWVDESARGQGVGRALMLDFEARATALGVTTFYLETWSFQARGFYEKLGYAVALEISGMGPGLVKYIMTRHQA